MKVTAVPAESRPALFSNERRVSFFRFIVLSPLLGITLKNSMACGSCRFWFAGVRRRFQRFPVQNPDSVELFLNVQQISDETVRVAEVEPLYESVLDRPSENS